MKAPGHRSLHNGREAPLVRVHAGTTATQWVNAYESRLGDQAENLFDAATRSPQVGSTCANAVA